MTIAVTGATGHLGRLALDALLARGTDASSIVAIGRNSERLASLPAGVQIRVADYNDPIGFAAALTGVDRLLLVSSSEIGQRVTQHGHVIAAAKEAEVDLIVYTSVANVETSAMALAAEHRATEKAIAESGLKHSFLRNGWYIENYTDQVKVQLQHGAVFGSAGEGRVSAATRADLADAAAVVLLAAEPRATYELGGDAFTVAEYAAVLSDVAGTAVIYQDLPAPEYAQVLARAGVPGPYVDLLVDSDLGLARGDLMVASQDLSDLLGRPVTPLAEAIRSVI